VAALSVTDRYERRYSIFKAVGKALNEALQYKMTSTETFRSFSDAVTNSCFVLDDNRLVAYLQEVRDHASKFQSIAIVMEALPTGGEKAHAARAAGEWLIDQIDSLPQKFEASLCL
jgi:hypothetical protein